MVWDWILASIVLQAILAMCSPLYFSNFGILSMNTQQVHGSDTVDSLFPCQLCWWAHHDVPNSSTFIDCFYEESSHPSGYIYAITFPGMALEAFHYILQKPGIIGKVAIENPFGCTAQNPCAIHVDYFGYDNTVFVSRRISHHQSLWALALFQKRLRKPKTTILAFIAPRWWMADTTALEAVAV